MDDGKANVMSLAMLNALQAAFDQAERDKTVPILKARGRHFSGGFDLNVFAKGSAQDQYLMVKAAPSWHCASCRFRCRWWPPATATPSRWGAFLIMSADHRIAAKAITASA